MKVWIIAAAIALGSIATAAAQAQLTQADIQRLQDAVYDASGDVSRLRDRDPPQGLDVQRLGVHDVTSSPPASVTPSRGALIVGPSRLRNVASSILYM